jgi:DNA-binding NarL/FixJ family response regulator
LARRDRLLSEPSPDSTSPVIACLSLRRIAGDLVITERTVTYHITSMFNKLRARNRTRAVKIALQNGPIK